MLNLLGMLTAARTQKKTVKAKPRNKPYLARQAKADEKYRLLLTGKELTTGEIATVFDQTHCGTLSSLYKLEARGLVTRAGVMERETGSVKGRGSIVWTWIANT